MSRQNPLGSIINVVGDTVRPTSGSSWIDVWVRTVFYWGFFGALLLMIGVPIAFYIWGSFWSEAPGLPGGHFTLEGYRQIFTSGVSQVFINTALIAIVGCFIALSLGISMMVISLKINTRGRQFIAFVLIVQYLLPSYLLALAWDFYAGPNGLVNEIAGSLLGTTSPIFDIHSVWGIALVAGANYAGLVYLLTSGAITSVPRSLEEAAKLNGASSVTVILKITLKLALPGLAIATVLILTRLVQSFGIPLILGLRDQIFVVATYMYLSLLNYPPNFKFVSAMGMTILFVSLIGLYLQHRITGAREQYETVDQEGTEVLLFDYGRLGGVAVAFAWFILLVVYILPFVILLLTSFQDDFIFDISNFEFTLDNYRVLFSGSRAGRFFNAVKNTLFLSGFGALFGMVLSVAASYMIVKSDSRVGRFVDYLTLAPIGVPGIIVATALLWILLSYNILGAVNALWFIMIGMTIKFIVYGSRATNSSFRAIDSQLEEAAEIFGASFFTIFKDIFIPLIKRGVSSGYILLFIEYLKVLTIPILLATSQEEEVLQVFLWTTIQYGEVGVSAAIAVIITVMIGLIYFLVTHFTDVKVAQL